MKYIIKRILISIIVLFGVSIIIFVMINSQPGNPYSHMISPDIPPEVVKSKLISLGYYDPLYIKYIKWLSRAVRFDLGYSIHYSKPVIEIIFSRLKNTITLMIPSFVLSVILGNILGIISAIYKHRFIDNMITIVSFIGISIPAFFLSLYLIYKFSFQYDIFPSSGMYSVRYSYVGMDKFLDILRHMVLPTIVLIVVQTTAFIRYTRASVIEEIDKPYIKTAISKGMSLNKAIIIHGYRNAFIPIITIFFMQFPMLFSGALMTETVFVWPGIGRLGYEAVQNRDYPLVMGILIISSVLILISNLIVDILYLKIDKRIKL